MAKTIHIGDEPFTVCVEGQYYRVVNITQFHSITTNKDNEEEVRYVNRPLKEGLCIEEKVEGSDNYIVVNTFKYDAETDEVKMEDIALRTKDTLESMDSRKDFNKKKFDEYLNCIEFAIQALKDMNE